MVYNELINNINLININNIISFYLFLFIIFALLLSLVIDVLFGELPGKIHPVVIMGSLINFFKKNLLILKIGHLV